MMRALFVLLALLLATTVPAAAQQRQLDPQDEAAKDASWADFKKQLLAAAQKRDRGFVLGMLDSDVRSGLEGERGPAEFSRQWGLDSDTSPFWEELAIVLALPAAYHRPEKGPLELCVPYVAVRWPQDMEAFGGGAILVEKALVKSAPSAAAETVATLSFHIVEVSDWEVNDRAADSKQKWVKISLKSGEGYVLEEQIRSPIEHAACFAKGEGGWRMTGFGPGGGK
jgi:hypothetical protein